uniref:SCP domain-containing protein n=1 Tax=Meloidogyne hapla TaxID=6305 RepID=A0A1I8BA75_MELHA
MSMKFGIWHNNSLTECLVDTEIQNHTAAVENMLPFSFSLKNEEFDTTKQGPSYSTSDDCKNIITCNFTSSECLKVADYSVAWARTEDYVN